MGSFDGYGYRTPNFSSGGCSGLGLDSQGNYGLVYKATSKNGGVWRNLSYHLLAPHHLVTPVHVDYIPYMRKFLTLIYRKNGIYPNHFYS